MRKRLLRALFYIFALPGLIIQAMLICAGKFLALLWHRFRVYDREALDRLYGDESELDLAIERLDHDYILDLTKAEQLIELDHIKAKMAMLIEAGLLEKALMEQWCDDFLCEADRVDAAKLCRKARIWRIRHSLPEGLYNKPFREYTSCEREEWWRLEMAKLAANAYRKWSGGIINCDLAAVPPLAGVRLYDDPQARERAILDKDLRGVYRMFGSDEHNLLYYLAWNDPPEWWLSDRAGLKEWIKNNREIGQDRRLSDSCDPDSALSRIRRRKSNKKLRTGFYLKNPRLNPRDIWNKKADRLRSRILERDFRAYASKRGLLDGITGDLGIPDDELARRIAIGMPGYDIIGLERLRVERALGAYGLPGLLANVPEMANIFDDHGMLDFMAFKPVFPGRRVFSVLIIDAYGPMNKTRLFSLRDLLIEYNRHKLRMLRIASRYCAYRDIGLFRDPDYIRMAASRKLSDRPDQVAMIAAMNEQELVSKCAHMVTPRPRWVSKY